MGRWAQARRRGKPTNAGQPWGGSALRLYENPDYLASDWTIETTPQQWECELWTLAGDWTLTVNTVIAGEGNYVDFGIGGLEGSTYRSRIRGVNESVPTTWSDWAEYYAEA